MNGEKIMYYHMNILNKAEAAKEEKCEWLPFCAPKQVIRNKDGHICALEMYKTELDDQGRLHQDDDQFIRIKCDFIISAFGSQIDDPLRKACAPLQFNKDGRAAVDLDHNVAQAAPWVFAGGDIIGNGTTVQAVNDGKVKQNVVLVVFFITLIHCKTTLVFFMRIYIYIYINL